MFGKIYRQYKYRFYPLINDVRGSYRLKRILKRTAEIGLEKTRSGEPIKERDWDNLFILDACRHDLYEQVRGETPHRFTQGSHSAEFVKKNFSSGDWTDTVVITANPHYLPRLFKQATGRCPEDVFAAVFHVYNTHWNNEIGTTLPSPVIRRTITAEKLWPEKRKVVHFMQPHIPFIQQPLTGKGASPNPVNNSAEHLWQKAEQGEYTAEEIWPRYRDNLEYVLPFIEELSEELKGKTVVTSDHGNLLGENGLYGHPSGMKSAPVRKVPWEVLE